MNHDDYQNLPAISSHWLIAMLDSPRQCWEKYLDPQRRAEESSDAMRLGTLVHCLALTPATFAREFAVMNCERRSKADRARWEWIQAQGLTPIRPAELEKARAIVAALQASPEARKLLRGGKKERTIIRPRAARGLLPLKARLDLHQETRRQVVELKTTYSIRTVETAMERYRYPLSAAFYQDMSRSLSVIFVFVQSAPPHEVAVIPMERQQLHAGREQWQAALARFDECWLANDWPEAEPAAPDKDPLLLDFIPATRPRFELSVGELAL